MSLCSHKVIIAVHGIKPRIKEEPCKLPLSDNKASRAQVLGIPCKYQFHVVRGQACGGLNHAFGGDDGNILEHERPQAILIENLGLKRLRRLHYQGMRTQMVEIGRLGVGSHGVTEGRDSGPASRGFFKHGIVVRHICKEIRVA